MTAFDHLGLADSLLRAVRDEGYHTATPIQFQAIPSVLTGRDLMGCAQTGTGKTAAFALPTLHRLSTSGGKVADDVKRRGKHRRNDLRPIRSLVLAPTRELAAQIGASFATYGRFTGLRYTVVFGGVGQGPQVRALENGVDVLVATPGRLLDLMEQGYIDLSTVEILILDEADQMLDMGFIVPLRRIVSSVPRARQTLMFSATMPNAIRKLAGEWLREPAHVQVCPVATPIESVEQSVYFVEPRNKPHLLTHFLQTTAFSRTIVFARTKHGADKIAKNLVRSGIRAAAIHGNKSQNVRQRTLEAFKSNRPPVLVATDIAARGLDVDGISHVINYELPEVPEIYVHRIGRTGRAGATGIATSFCGREERDQLRQIERLTRRTLAVEQNHPEYPTVTPASSDESRRSHSNGARSRRPGGGGRPSTGGSSKSRRPALQGQGAQPTNGSSGGPSVVRRRRRPGGARRRAL
ncbi:MAG: DEAD/DEAH box helicase [Planctomycetes bacterium]|nr:DEAD/DEAH box helicase [Planctomycetota bacterium]